MTLKPFLLASLIAIVLLSQGCSGHTSQDVNPKTLDFTGRDTTGNDSAFDQTNGPEINSDHTSGPFDERRMAARRTEPNELHLNSRTKITTEEITADQVALMDPVAKAIILETDNNAFVAIKLDKGSDALTDELHRKISRVVKANVEHADAVFISDNPDFYQKMGSYSNAVQARKPVQIYIDDFSETIRRIFPDAR